MLFYVNASYSVCVFYVNASHFVSVFYVNAIVILFVNVMVKKVLQPKYPYHRHLFHLKMTTIHIILRHLQNTCIHMKGQTRIPNFTK
jgi:hypothetical protein